MMMSHESTSAADGIIVCDRHQTLLLRNNNNIMEPCFAAFDYALGLPCTRPEAWRVLFAPPRHQREEDGAPDALRWVKRAVARAGFSGPIIESGAALLDADGDIEYEARRETLAVHILPAHPHSYHSDRIVTYAARSADALFVPGVLPRKSIERIELYVRRNSIVHVDIESVFLPQACHEEITALTEHLERSVEKTPWIARCLLGSSVCGMHESAKTIADFFAWKEDYDRAHRTEKRRDKLRQRSASASSLALGSSDDKEDLKAFIDAILASYGSYMKAAEALMSAVESSSANVNAQAAFRESWNSLPLLPLPRVGEKAALRIRMLE